MKPSKFSQTSAALLGFSLFLCASSARAQEVAQVDWNQKYRREYEVPRGTTYTGRSPYMKDVAQPEPATPVYVETPAPQPVPVPAPVRTSCADPTGGLIRLTKSLPAEGVLGGEFEAQLKVTAVGCAANVVVRDVIPAGMSYLKSQPAATVDGNTLAWSIGDMEAGQTVNIKIALRADKEGSLVNCANVSADPRVCAAMFVGQPRLAIEKTGPATARFGDNVTYNIIVKNTGNSVARKVVVNDPVPDGCTHASGQSELFAELGDLAPGQSKELTATFKAAKRGKICNVATATSSNAGKASDDACTLIQQPGLKVAKTGTKSQIIGRKAEYQIIVQNTGDADLANVRVVDVAPEGTTLVAATGASISGNQAGWVIPNLAAGASETLNVTVIGKVAGNLCNRVDASSSGLNDSAEACTVWRGIAGVLLEVVDDPDPIQIGDTTTYTIHVTNQGFADIHNVKVVSTFDGKIDPVSSPQGSVSGKTVDFPVVPVIGSKRSVAYTITAKGVSAGDSRNKVSLTSDELTSPVDENESTTVY